jgi:hypothetical protein
MKATSRSTASLTASRRVTIFKSVGRASPRSSDSIPRAGFASDRRHRVPGRIETGRDIYVGADRLHRDPPPWSSEGGYTNTSIESAFTDGDSDFDTSVDGYRLGAGIEQMIGTNVYAKGEYRYSNYKGLKLDDDLFGDEDFDIDLDRHQVMFGVGLRF